METKSWITFSGRFNYRAGAGCTAHIHPKDYQIQLVCGGAGSMRINNNTFQIKEGDVVFTTKGSSHEFISDAKKGMRTLEVKFDSNDDELLNNIPMISKDKNGKLFNLLSILVLEGQKMEYLYKRICNIKLEEILLTLARLAKNKDTYLESVQENTDLNMDIVNSTAMEGIDTFIYNNIDRNFSLSELSKACGYNQDYLYRVIKKEKGITLIQYVNKIRFQEAKRLIYQTKLSISEIAWNLGFESLPYFSRFFKKYAGIAPYEFCLQIRSSIRTDY